MIEMGVRRWAIPLDEAKLAVAGYAFATRPVSDQDRAPKWGYQTYDCILASPGRDFSDLDIFVADGLDAKLSTNAVGALRAATSRAAHDLAIAASRDRPFVDLDPEELSDDPPSESTGWLLARAYQCLADTRDVGLARAHKVLHHKQPLLIPLLDSVTAAIYPGSKGQAPPDGLEPVAAHPR